MDPLTPNNKPSEESDSGTLNRRRLLRAGAVAGPLVLTLRGGTAWAASSPRCNFVDGVQIPDSELSERCRTSLGLPPVETTPTDTDTTSG